MLTQLKTFTGKLIDPVNPSPEDIDIRDIAHALARMPRFAGHTKEFYSVAEHCLRCLKFAKSEEYMLELLLHDATEAYIMDIPKPVKNRLPDYIRIEKTLANHIDIAFGLYSQTYKKQIKEIDNLVLQEELRYVLDNEDGAPLWYRTKRTFEEIEQIFLNEYWNLTNL